MRNLKDKTIVVTGAASGIGAALARQLHAKGAILALVDIDQHGLEELAAEIFSQASIHVADVGDRARMTSLPAEVIAVHGHVDVLINNAGVMAPPRMETADGFELQLGTNHLGHFALTGRLLPKLLAADAARIVNVSSAAHRQGKMDFEDLNWEQSYSRWPAYGRSKLANLLFTFELDRRLRAADQRAIAVACHPGYSATNLQSAGPGEGTLGLVLKPVMKLTNVFLAQSDEMGALPTLYAATAADVEGGDYIGPDGIAEARGHPTKVGCSSRARAVEDADRLWHASVELTGVDYAALG